MIPFSTRVACGKFAQLDQGLRIQSSDGEIGHAGLEHGLAVRRISENCRFLLSSFEIGWRARCDTDTRRGCPFRYRASVDDQRVAAVIVVAADAPRAGSRKRPGRVPGNGETPPRPSAARDAGAVAAADAAARSRHRRRRSLSPPPADGGKSRPDLVARPRFERLADAHDDHRSCRPLARLGDALAERLACAVAGETRRPGSPRWSASPRPAPSRLAPLSSRSRRSTASASNPSAGSGFVRRPSTNARSAGFMDHKDRPHDQPLD